MCINIKVWCMKRRPNGQNCPELNDCIEIHTEDKTNLNNVPKNSTYLVGELLMYYRDVTRCTFL